MLYSWEIINLYKVKEICSIRVVEYCNCRFMMYFVVIIDKLVKIYNVFCNVNLFFGMLYFMFNIRNFF